MTDLRQAALEQQQAEPVAFNNTRHAKLMAKFTENAEAMTALAPPQAEPPSEWLLIKNILDEYGLQAIDFVAEFKAAQQVVTIWKQAKPFSPEIINTTQTAWKMGYEAAKAEQRAEPEPVKFQIFKPASPVFAIPDVSNQALPWVYDQDPSTGFAASMWVTPTTPQRKPLPTVTHLPADDKKGGAL